MPALQAIARRISRSQILADYQIAFEQASGLPLRFQALDTQAPKSLPFSGYAAENPFCALLSKTQEGCRMCQAVDTKIRRRNGTQPVTEVCLAGLVDTAVPVLVHGTLAGHLRTGQVALQKPEKEHFSRIARTLVDWGLQTDLSRAEEAWFHSKVLEPVQFEAFIQLLKVFASHIGMAAEQMPAAQQEPGPPVIQKAIDYIAEHQQEDVHIDEVAKTLNVSVFYFCKLFKKATGKTFTEYLAEVRIAKAKNLLLNPHVRISEAAFESGFQSITHFNRVFRKLTGCSPSAFRESLRSGWGAESPADHFLVESRG